MRAAASAAVLLGLALCLLTPAHGLYFYITEGQQRCFVEEVPPSTLVLATVKNPDTVPSETPGAAPVGLKLTVTDPAGSLMMTREVPAEGRIAFSSILGGQHSLCFATNSSRWFGNPRKFRLDLRVDVGEMAIDYKEIAKKEHLSGVELEVRKLTDKVRDIIKEQHYQREREETFRNTSESTNSRVQWWSIAQTIVLIASGVWQIMHLKKFFIEKKLK